MQVVVPSVSCAATPHGRAATITVDTPSRPGRDSPVGENGASSATPWTAGEAVGSWPDAGCLVKAVGGIPPAGAVADGTPVPPPMTAPVVVAFGIPGALVRFPDEPLPRAFKLGLFTVNVDQQNSGARKRGPAPLSNRN